MVDDIIMIKVENVDSTEGTRVAKRSRMFLYESPAKGSRSHYYIAPYYNACSEGLERFKWQKIRRTREEAWSMDGSLRSITATIQCDHVD